MMNRNFIALSMMMVLLSGVPVFGMEKSDENKKVMEFNIDVPFVVRFQNDEPARLARYAEILRISPFQELKGRKVIFLDSKEESWMVDSDAVNVTREGLVPLEWGRCIVLVKIVDGQKTHKHIAISGDVFGAANGCVWKIKENPLLSARTVTKDENGVNIKKKEKSVIESKYSFYGLTIGVGALVAVAILYKMFGKAKSK